MYNALTSVAVRCRTFPGHLSHLNRLSFIRSAPIQTSQSTIAPTNIKNLPGMSRSLSLLLLTLPLLLMSYRMSGTHRSASHTRASSLHATTSRNLLDDQSASTDDRYEYVTTCCSVTYLSRSTDSPAIYNKHSLKYSFTPSALCSKFSFEKLPNPLKANSQKTALKLVALSRKVQNLLTALSQEQVVKVTGLTIEKINKIIVKSEKIEQKLLEGLSIGSNLTESNTLLFRSESH